MSDLCEKVGANIDDIAKGMGLDKRIGNKFLHTGPGYGGSCFPKDTVALVKTANDSKSNISIVEETIKYNDFRKKFMVEKIRSSVDEISNKNIAVLGLSFKPETDDMRYSPSIDIINGLLNLMLIYLLMIQPQWMKQRKFFQTKLIIYLILKNVFLEKIY